MRAIKWIRTGERTYSSASSIGSADKVSAILSDLIRNERELILYARKWCDYQSAAPSARVAFALCAKQRNR